MEYGVKQLAKLAGISVRTLHYYDEIGLLHPLFIKKNGYRVYGEKELLKLQQILFFRELEFSLEKIKTIMESKNFNSIAALVDQQKLLEIKKKRVEELIITIKKTIDSMKGGGNMTQDDSFSVFNDPTYQKYKDEVEQKWGNTSAYKQSMERVGKMSKADLEKIKQEGEAISQKIVYLMRNGFTYDSLEVQKQVDKFYKHLHHFYDPNYEMFKGLGQLYVDDPRFSAIYEKRAKGFAAFMRDAMVLYAEKNLQK